MIPYLIHIPVLVVLILLIYRINSDLKQVFFPALIFKLACGVLLGLFYWNSGTGDTLVYHDEATKFTQVIREDPASNFSILYQHHPKDLIPDLRFSREPRALFFTRIVASFYLITFDNYWITALYFSLFSFLGMYLMGSILSRREPAFKWPSILAFLFFPSIVFWSSGLLKESLTLGSMGVLFYLSMRPWQRKETMVNLLGFLLVLILTLLLWNLKYFYAVLFIPILIILQLEYGGSAFQKHRYRWMLYVSPFFLFLVLTFFHPNLNLDRFWDIVVKNHYLLADRGLESIRFSGINSSFFSLFPNLPAAILLGWFGPFLNFNNLYISISSLESLILAFLFATVSW